MLASRGIFVHKRLVRLIVMFVWDQLAVRPPAAVSRGLKSHRLQILQKRPRRDRQAARLEEIYTRELLMNQRTTLNYLPPASLPVRRIEPFTEDQLSLAYRLEERARARGDQEEIDLWKLVIQAMRP
jgi:hypothetical protein